MDRLRDWLRSHSRHSSVGEEQYLGRFHLLVYMDQFIGALNTKRYVETRPARQELDVVVNCSA